MDAEPPRVTLQEMDRASSEAARGDPVAAHVDVRPRQDARSGGITITLLIENRATAPVILVNPLDTLQLVLLDATGAPVELPIGTLPRLVINSPGPVEVVRPFRVVAMGISGSESSLLAQADAATLSVPPRSTLNITLQIDRRGGASPRALGAGTYQVKVVLPLIGTSAGVRNRVVASDFLPVELAP